MNYFSVRLQTGDMLLLGLQNVISAGILCSSKAECWVIVTKAKKTCSLELGTFGWLLCEGFEPCGKNNIQLVSVLSQSHSTYKSNTTNEFKTPGHHLTQLQATDESVRWVSFNVAFLALQNLATSTMISNPLFHGRLWKSVSASHLRGDLGIRKDGVQV